MLGTLGQSIAIMGQKLGQAELARADVVIRPQVLDIGSADFSQRANAILEGEKAALAVMPQIRERVARCRPSAPKPNARPSKRRQKPSNRPAWSSAAACKAGRYGQPGHLLHACQVGRRGRTGAASPLPPAPFRPHQASADAKQRTAGGGKKSGAPMPSPHG